MTSYDRLLHEVFDARAQEAPARTALLTSRESISYGRLNEQADRIARSLIANGFLPGARIGVHIERSFHRVAAVLGVLKSGGTVVPLPPTYPAERLGRIGSHCDAVIDDDGSRFAGSQALPVLGIEELFGAERTRERSARGSTAALPAISAEAPAFILSSSGSTGHPKMIVRSHRSFFHRLTWMWEHHPFGIGDLGCQKAHMTTTHSLYELFEPLLAGAPTLIVGDTEARNLERFWQTLTDHGVTRLLIVPSALRASMDMPHFQPPALEVVVLMGEYVSPQLARRAVEAFPESTHLYSIYGSTEASSTLVVDLRDSLRPGEELPLGTPITPEVTALVLDDELRPVPPGDAGRLYISGPPLFSGYLNDPELTASVMVDPPGSVHDKPLFDTRDQVRRSADGNLHFVGRVDHTVKVRGFRIDLPEVERAIRGHPGVSQATVVVSGAGTPAVSLFGFYVPARIDQAEVYGTIREQLPAYMVPSILIGLDEFPLTPSAKVDRTRLLEMVEERGGTHGKLSSTEEKVAEAWASVLGHRRFHPDSSFFEVGGTSLTVFAAIHRLREAFDLQKDELPEESFFRFPTLEGVSQLVDRLVRGEEIAIEADTPILLTLRTAAAEERAEAPLILVPSAGGTLGAYELLVRALPGGREILGLRDPYLWGERELHEGFSEWIDRYVAAIRRHRPTGPYAICAYSSAGAFGYEIARRLRLGDENVDLILVDPLALDRSHRGRYGYWAFRSVWMRRSFRRIIAVAGRLRTPFVKVANRMYRRPAPNYVPGREQVDNVVRATRTNREHLMNLAALLELNTGSPYALQPADFEGVPREASLDVLTRRVTSTTPEMDAESIGRIATQYEIQVRVQHAYRLRRFDGPVLLAEPESPHAGMLSALVRPHVRALKSLTLPLGEAESRTRVITERFGRLTQHYRCMRDQEFVDGLARALGRTLTR